jgi:hypothetical protein
MKTYKIAWEIQVNANSPLEAAKDAVTIMRDADNIAQQFYVQDEDTNEVVSVDLDEPDEDAVLPVANYTPLICQ